MCLPNRSPYWYSLVGLPVGWLLVAIMILPSTEWHAHADPDNDWRFLIAASAMGGTILGTIVGMGIAFGIRIGRSWRSD